MLILFDFLYVEAVTPASTASEVAGPTINSTKSQTRNCFVCYSCSRVETSQSLPCSKERDRCITIELITGQVDRDCSNDKRCENEKKNPVNKIVDCCSDDNCN